MNTSVSLYVGTNRHDCKTTSRELRNFVGNGDPSRILKNLRLKNVNRLTYAQLNINSLRNKLDSLVDIVNNNIDILIISEKTLDSSLPNDSFIFMAF